MGSCFSIGGDDSVSQSTAKVISSSGNLSEYSIPMNVSQVLEIESVSKSCFVCNSDKLFYDDYIKAMDSNEELRMGQIYFILPMNRLKFRITASDMAALAVKASSALKGGGGNGKKKNSGRSGRNKMIRISPVHESSSSSNYGEEGYAAVVGDGMMKRFEKPAAIVEMKRSGSVKKLQRNASRRAKFAIRSFRMRLNTIYEGRVDESLRFNRFESSVKK